MSIKAIISASNPGNVLDVRVIRLSDNAAVAEQTNLSFSGGPSERIVSLGIQAASIPDTEDIFEVQLRHAGGPGQSRIHEISLEF